MAPKTSPAQPGPPIHVLVVDDDQAHAEAVSDSLASLGYACTIATSGAEGAELIERRSFEIIVSDLRMPKLGGLELLAKAKQDQPDAEVILVTGHGTIETAVEAMQQGASHFLLKPLDLQQLRRVVDNVARAQHLRRANAELSRRLDERFGFESLIGNSPPMRELIDRLRRVAPTDATVLIEGETGTGKELVAQAIHQNSPRKKGHFVGLNCAALSEHILEGELFGSVPGAFTDARDRKGKFEYADGGTLFLDEVGDMPVPTQIKLLRVLESGEITRVGSNETVKVDVRILSATNRNLVEAVERGDFREDLYHRLKVISFRLPSLGERSQDIPLLIDHFMKMHASRHSKQIKSMTTAARRRLMAFPWTGNVRQLKNALESMVVVDYDEVLDVDDLPPELGPPETEEHQASSADGLCLLVGKPLAEIELMFIGETLKVTGGNREEAAKMLGIGERTLYRKIKEHDLK